ncbi:radical SAM domain-containing protein [Gottschalkia acidurici 9a]|uniref:Radical SAM domain-containing protein n=1 Tax=Gottschalkia acidurici (strain ATCC 7906 / DSM 604 / BCRC 14475 / CIP 104303 / KCTC 5404 / NCIMB 10678 / 9a) TaxID=1128398 RepID=K0B1R2_GOTA9|nr:radical SAM protein [Gottschalkia acidurici]AFS78636.1 radical SAM domain-containing protein [Gottschalkia acidurici 9a]
MSNKHHIIPIFVPHVGCPHDCVFCNQKKITGVSTDITSKDVDNTIKSYLETIPESNERLEVAFYGGSFTGIDRNIQRELLNAAYKYKKQGLIDRIRLSTRPDYIDIEELNLLKNYGVDIIELGVQSMDTEVLYKSNRGHSQDDVYKSSKLIKDFGFKLGLQMMVGLPGDNGEKSINTAKELIKLKPDLVRIYPTLIVKDTYLEKLYEIGEYLPISLEESINICSDLLMLFELNDVNVIRIGLQPTDIISSESESVIGGPFHPSFRQLVESNIYRLILLQSLDKINITTSSIRINISKKEVSNIVGQKSINIKMIKDRYRLKKVSTIGLEASKDSFDIIDGEKKYNINRKQHIREYLESKKYC